MLKQSLVLSAFLTEMDHAEFTQARARSHPRNAFLFDKLAPRFCEVAHQLGEDPISRFQFLQLRSLVLAKLFATRSTIRHRRPGQFSQAE